MPTTTRPDGYPDTPPPPPSSEEAKQKVDDAEKDLERVKSSGSIPAINAAAVALMWAKKQYEDALARESARMIPFPQQTPQAPPPPPEEKKAEKSVWPWVIGLLAVGGMGAAVWYTRNNAPKPNPVGSRPRPEGDVVLDRVTEEATYEFWQSVAKSLPDATGGDLPIAAEERFNTEANEAVRTWWSSNRP